MTGPMRPVPAGRGGRASRRPPGPGSSTPFPPGPPPCRSGPGRRSVGGRTHWSSPRPARARRWRRSCRPSITWAGSTRQRLRPERLARTRIRPTACGSSTSHRSRRWGSTSSATCAGRWRGSAPSAPPAPSRWECARGTRPRGSVVGCARIRRKSSSRRRSRYTSCSLAPRARRCERWRASSSMRSTPSRAPSAARTWRSPWSASTPSWGAQRSAWACPRRSRPAGR